MDHTNANVMVREHPAQITSKIYKYVDLLNAVPIMKENNDRIYFASADTKINTYQYIENCKLVLPYTSTTGIESILLGKNVILHAKVYYEDIGIAYKAKTVEDYFEAISFYLEHPDNQICKNLENAYLAYYYRMNTSTTCEYGIHHINWLNYTFDELCRLPGISTMIAAIGPGIPPIYSQIEAQLTKA